MCQLLLTQSLLHFQLNSTSEMKPAKGVKIDIHIDSTTINTQNSNASVPKVHRKTYEIIYSIQIIKFEIIFIYYYYIFEHIFVSFFFYLLQQFGCYLLVCVVRTVIIHQKVAT